MASFQWWIWPIVPCGDNLGLHFKLMKLHGGKLAGQETRMLCLMVLHRHMETNVLLLDVFIKRMYLVFE